MKKINPIQPPLFETLPNGLVYKSESGSLTYINLAALRILGLTEEQFKGGEPRPSGWHIIFRDGTPAFVENQDVRDFFSPSFFSQKKVVGIFDPKIEKYSWASIQSTEVPAFDSTPDYRFIFSLSEITEQIDAEDKLKYQSELFELLVSTSAAFINLPEVKIHDTIQFTLEKLGKFVEADRMYVFEYDWLKNTCSNTYEWCADEITPQLELLQEVPLEGLEAWSKSHLKGESMKVDDVSKLDKTSTLWQILEPQGIKSLLAMPIMNKSDCIGFIGLDSVKSIHLYSQNEINLLNIFTGILANVKNRLESERQLKERIKELNSIYQVSNLTFQNELPEDTLFERTVEIIPSGFFHPELTSVRLTYQNKTIQTPDFKGSSVFIKENILVNNDVVGGIEVFLPEGENFLAEEHQLIQPICNIIGQYFESKINLGESRKRERELKNLLKTQTSYVFRINLAGKPTYWNQKFEEEFGWIYGDKGIENGGALDSIFEYHHQRTIASVEECIQSPGKIVSIELDKPSRDGSAITTLWEFVALVDESGLPIEIQCMGINISERKKIQNKLQESENRLRGLLESQTNYVVRTNFSGVHTYWNKKYELDFEIFLKEQESESLNFLLSFCEHDIEKAKNTFQQCINTPGKIFQVELDQKINTQKTITVLWDFVCLLDEQNNPIEVQCVGIDITGKKETEAALLKSEERFRQIAEHTGAVIWEVDTTGRYTYLGPIAKRVFGYDSEEIVGKKCFWDLFPPSHREELKEKAFDYINTGKELFAFENTIQRKDGKVIWVSSFGSAVRDEAGRILAYRGADYEITYRKEVEKELQQFREISDRATYGTVITKFDSRIITYCNQAFAKMHGYEIDELIGKDIFILHNQEQLDYYFENVFPEYQKNNAYSLKEFWRKRKDGTLFPGLVTAQLFFDDDGTPLFNASTVTDVTNQKIFEEKIKEQNLRLKSIIDAIPDLLYIMDKDGNYLEYFSSNLEKQIGEFGYLKGKNIKEIFTEEIADLHLQKIQKAINERAIQTYEYPGIVGYENRYFESRLVPMTQSKVLRFVREITDRKNNEREIRKLNLAIEQSPVAIVITDLKGNLEYMSPAFLKMTGYSYEELIGKPISLIKSNQTSPEVYIELWKTICDGKTWQNEWKNKKKSGEYFWESISITPLLDENGKIKNFLAIKQDITERKKFENEIVELNQNLEKRIIARTQELELTNEELQVARSEAESANQAKSEFLSRMSHELRTPMNSILGFAQLLELTELSSSQKKSLEYILKSGGHLLQLINEVLEIARIESGAISISLEPINVLNTLQEVVDLVSPFALNKTISIRIDSGSLDKPFVVADLQRLKQILINLLNNAIKYNLENGQVLIFLETIAENNEATKLRINVRDTGIGISENDMGKLFIPFERGGNSNSNIEGTGLGLSVVEKLTKIMGGSVGVESQIGVGSTFWVDLPISTYKTEDREKTNSFIGTLSIDVKTKGTVLLIEDNVSNIELIREFVRNVKPDIQLITSMYGLECVSLVKKFDPSLILLDLNLPDVHGSLVLDQLKADSKTKSYPVIVVSADATPKQIEEMLEKGATGYITKPIVISDLIKIFDRYLTPISNE